MERRAPDIAIGRARVTPPPGAFLQATVAGEEILARLVGDAVGDAKRAADLYCGIGTFALRLAEKAEVYCVESDAGALAAGCGADARLPAFIPSPARRATCSPGRF